MSSASDLRLNPFAVKTPETLDANELVNLFVPYPEFQNLQVSGHQFLHGHRGSGKSMMLRMMTPLAQCITAKCTLDELPYYGAYLSIKATEVNSIEYHRLEDESGGLVLSEHVLVTKLLSALFVSINVNCDLHNRSSPAELQSFLENVLYKRLSYVGWDISSSHGLSAPISTNVDSLIKHMIDVFDSIQYNTSTYVKRRGFTKDYIPYLGPLLGFQDTLLPIVNGLKEYKILPNCPVFFLLDDADNLTLQQTKILNTWVSYRSTDTVSLKISTQMGYKTYLTSSGLLIEAPHDYSEINFTSVYTGSVKESYPKLVNDIVAKRLQRIGLSDVSPAQFFPEDPAQKDAIRAISDELKEQWQTSDKGGYRPEDDAYRFARPEYIRRLSGSSKQGARYKYAGFDQLVHISSGIIRFFLEPAARMFADQVKENGEQAVRFISPEIQDDEIRKQSDDLVVARFDDLKTDILNNSSINDLSNIDRLRNLIHAIGAVFQAHIMDKDASQRRVFSFSISDTPSDDLHKLLQAGVRYGYLYEDTIGKKSGIGRQKLYVLTRRLAPAFKLDPMGFSGYLSFTSQFLTEISINPGKHISRLRKNGLSTIEEGPQLSLLIEPTNE